ncbi:MAG: hypothetical protein ACFFAH_17530 [Promethearchaeota archaeon]
MYFQEGADIMETVIDPMLLIFYVIATIIFIASSYKKGELRMFGLTILLMAGAIVWCIIGVEILEGIFVLTASVIAVVGAIILRIKTRKLEG